MKHLKLSVVLLLAITFITSCDKENIQDVELNTKKESIQELSSAIQVMYLSEMDIDLNKNATNSSKTSSSFRIESNTDSNLFVIDTRENMPSDLCSDYEMINFDELSIAPGHANGNYGPWTEHSSHWGPAIPSGVTFHLLSALEQEQVLWMYGSGWIFQQGRYPTIGTNTGSLNYFAIDFDMNDVNSVGLEILPWFVSDIKVEVFGMYGLIDEFTLYDAAPETFFGVNSNEPIKRIQIRNLNNSASYWGLDDILIGTSNDFDCDGVSNQYDPLPNSNISDELSFDGCYPGVSNQFSAPGTTMMDEVDDVIAGVWEMMYSPNKRRNFDPQKQFQRDMSVLLNSWYRRYDALVTDAEKFKITKCVRQSRIFEDQN